MELNVQLMRSRESLKKNKLCQVSVENPVVTWKEEHEDSEPEIVDLAFHIPQSGMAIVSNEYRNKDVRKSKAADLLCISFDDEKKRILVQIFDSKRTMTGYDETKSVDALRGDIVKRIKEFILQIQDSILHKEGLTSPYVKYYGYEENLCAGIITREFDQEKLKRLEEKMHGAVCSSNRDLGMVGQKYHIATAGIRKDIEIVKEFRNKKITVLNMKLNLQVYLLEYSAKKQGYYVKIEIGEKIS